jgi:hypothetical protein
MSAVSSTGKAVKKAVRLSEPTLEAEILLYLQMTMTGRHISPTLLRRTDLRYLMPSSEGPELLPVS